MDDLASRANKLNRYVAICRPIVQGDAEAWVARNLTELSVVNIQDNALAQGY
jgi:hypothetical protein